tara:strand:- start:8606 stop:8959 length:354 start_codon:yes stop_codon:yes gene_type:complete
MIVDFVDSKVLLQASIDEALYEKLVAQITKDFGLAAIAVELPLQVSPKNLKTILHQKIYQLMLDRFTDYLNVLYIVDVSEKSIKEIQAIDPIEIADQVSFLILKREYQKVWFRNKYS